MNSIDNDGLANTDLFEYKVLLKATQDVTKSMTMDAVFESVVTAGYQLMGKPRSGFCYICLERDGDYVFHTRRPKPRKSKNLLLPTEHIPYRDKPDGVDMIGQVFLDGRIQRRNDGGRQSDLPEPLKGVKSILVVPIVDEGSVKSAIVLGHPAASGISSKLEEMLVLLAETAAVAANARLYANQAKQQGILQSVLAAATDGILVLDEKDGIMTWNKRFAQLWGINEVVLRSGNISTLRSQMYRQLIDPSGFKGAVQELAQNPDQEYYPREPLKLITEITLEWYGLPIFDSDQVLIGKVFYFHDAGPRLRQIEERIKQEEVEKAKVQQTKFLSNLAHDLRSPLNSVMGFSELILREGNLTDKQRHRIKTVLQGAQLLNDLVDDTMSISKIEAGKLELNLDGMAFVDMLAGIVEMIHVKAADKGLEFVYLPDDLPVLVEGDRALLSRVLLNLLENAVKYTETGRVTFIVRRVDTPCHIKFEILDTGPGIAKEKQKEIFKRFVQVETGLSWGMGLGLNIAHELVQKMGGDLKVSSSQGKGSSFYFTLDFKEILQENHSFEKVAVGFKSEKIPRILVVDDEEPNRLLLEEHLKRLGFHVVGAENGLACLKEVQKAKPDLVLMDLKMPVMDGFDATTKLRDIYSQKELPIVAQTAHGKLLPEIEQHRMNGFLFKPIALKDLVNELSQHLALEWQYGTGSPWLRPREIIHPPEELKAELLKHINNGALSRLREWVDKSNLEEDWPEFFNYVKALVGDGKLNDLHVFLASKGEHDG